MPLKLHRPEKGGNWHYRGTLDGTRLRGTCGTKDKAKASRKTAQIEEDFWKCSFDGPGAALTFAQAAILYRAAEKSERFLEPVEDYWKNTAVKSITAGGIRQAAIVILPNVSNATRNRQVIVPTQAVINHAAASELCNRISVPRYKAETKIKTPATWPWIEAFMAEASPHMGALACFMFLTAARIGEALKVRWSDIDLQSGRVLIRQTKVGKERLAHLPPVLVAAVANIPSNRDPDETVFKYSTPCAARPVWNSAINRAGLKRLTFHCCRHGFATELLHKGVDPVTIASLGGWADPSLIFKTYGHPMQDDTLANLLIDRNLTKSDFKNRINIMKSNS